MFGIRRNFNRMLWYLLEAKKQYCKFSTLVSPQCIVVFKGCINVTKNRELRIISRRSKSRESCALPGGWACQPCHYRSARGRKVRLTGAGVTGKANGVAAGPRNQSGGEASEWRRNEHWFHACLNRHHGPRNLSPRWRRTFFRLKRCRRICCHLVAMLRKKGAFWQHPTWFFTHWHLISLAQVIR